MVSGTSTKTMPPPPLPQIHPGDQLFRLYRGQKYLSSSLQNKLSQMRLLDAPKTGEPQEYLFSGCAGDEVDCEKRAGNLNFGGLLDRSGWSATSALKMEGVLLWVRLDFCVDPS